jgi:hypothetical protein
MLGAVISQMKFNAFDASLVSHSVQAIAWYNSRQPLGSAAACAAVARLSLRQGLRGLQQAGVTGSLWAGNLDVGVS